MNPAMEIQLNGEAAQVPDGVTVSGLLDHLEVDLRRVAVEINRDVVRKATYGEHRVQAGDAVEIVSFVGGG